MKTYVLFLALLISGLAVAQSTINYKALIKDGSGNILANQTLNVRLGIINNTTATTVYQERFLSQETDNNGLIILEIGSGFPSIGFYTSISWNDGDTYGLKVEVDLLSGSGYVDMGTSNFNAVPFAKVASTIANTPARTLEIAGVGEQKIRINSETGNEVALEFQKAGSGIDWKIEHSNSWLDILTTDDNFVTDEIKFTFRNNGRLGINTNNPNVELDVDGTMRSSNLAGSGTRNVVASASGSLIVDTETKYISLNPVAFDAKTPSGGEVDFTVIRSNGMAGQSGDKVFQTNLNIPNGATISGIWVYYVDNSPSSDMSFRLERWSINSNTSAFVLNGTSTGNSSASQVLMSSPVSFTTVDNTTYSYIFTVRSTNWESQMYVTGVVIGYTE